MERLVNPGEDWDHEKIDIHFIDDFLQLDKRWRRIVREVTRGQLARQAIDQFKEVSRREKASMGKTENGVAGRSAHDHRGSRSNGPARQ